MKPNDRISKQEQLESLQEDVQQTGTGPACGTVPVVGTQVDMSSLIVFHVACGAVRYPVTGRMRWRSGGKRV